MGSFMWQCHSILWTTPNLFAKISHSNASSKLPFVIRWFISWYFMSSLGLLKTKPLDFEIKAIWLKNGFVTQTIVSFPSISGNATKKALPRHSQWLLSIRLTLSVVEPDGLRKLQEVEIFVNFSISLPIHLCIEMLLFCHSLYIYFHQNLGGADLSHSICGKYFMDN